MNIQEMQREAEEVFLFANRLSPLDERAANNYLKSIAASLLATTHQQENLLKELQVIKAAVLSLASSDK